MTDHSQSDILCCYFLSVQTQSNQERHNLYYVVQWLLFFTRTLCTGEVTLYEPFPFNASVDFKINCVKRRISKRMIGRQLSRTS